jgi:hypothetical protein
MQVVRSGGREPVAGLPGWPDNLRRKEAARYLREVHGIPVEAATLAKWFSTRSDGPPAYVAGRVPLYPRSELDAWATGRLGPLRRSTSR